MMVSSTANRTWSVGLLVASLALAALLAWGPGVAVAASGKPAWTVDSLAEPSDFSPVRNTLCEESQANAEWIVLSKVCDLYAVTVTNAGSRPTNGGAVSIRDTLPAGLTVRHVALTWSGLSEVSGRSDIDELPFCSTVGLAVSCTIPESFFAEVFERPNVKPDDVLRLTVAVTVNEPTAPKSLTNTVTVEGGGAAKVEGAGENTVVTSPPPGFGLSAVSAPLLGSEGLPETQAGGHPYELPVKLDLNTSVRDDPEGEVRATSVQDLRDVVIDLPLGVVGSAVAAPECTLHQLSAEGEAHEQGVSGCPKDTVVGHIRSFPEGLVAADGDIYNVVPERGVAAELGFVDTLGDPHVIYASIAPTPEGYELRSTTHEIPQVLLDEVTANVYGNPAARDKSSEPQIPMFTNPSDCTGEPLKTRVFVDSWQSPGSYEPDGSPDLEDPNWAEKTVEAPPVTGCEALTALFAPELEANTEAAGASGQAAAADSPSGLSVNLTVPQQEGAESPATPPLKEAIVTLPAGMAVNPASANGLAACSEAQIGWLGKSATASGEYENFSEKVLNPETGRYEATTCPNDSKIGTVEVEAPALAKEGCVQPGRTLKECEQEELEENEKDGPRKGVSLREKTPLHGSIYIASQSENPYGALFAAYMVIDDARTGIIAKVPAEIEAGGEEGVSGLASGQLRTVVKDSPQFPFSDLRVHIFPGADATLRAPATCGTYTLSSRLTPWSEGEGEVPATPSGSFQVTQNPSGGSCPSSLGFTPSMQAGVSNSQAAGFSAFTFKLTRADDTEELKGVNVTLPPGVTGKIAGIPLCSTADIEQAERRDHPGEGRLEQAHPSCPAESELGTVTVGVGSGPNPYYNTLGHAYLAGPYDGAPFDMVVVTPAVAGPFDLGTVVVRNPLYINPATAQVTAKSGPLPTILDGIPVDIRSIVINVSRPGFILNPTNCAEQTITTEATSLKNVTNTLTGPFYASGCTTLPFKPSLTASAEGKGSKTNGVGFSVKLQTPGIGQADIHKVDLTLPAVLPSRLSTIQQACPVATFNANPATATRDRSSAKESSTRNYWKAPCGVQPTSSRTARQRSPTSSSCYRAKT